MLARTPLSATETHHYSHGLHSVWLKVYFQDLEGRIRTVSGNNGGASEVAVDKANLNNQFAAISWGGPETGIEQEVCIFVPLFHFSSTGTVKCVANVRVGTSLLYRA